MQPIKFIVNSRVRIYLMEVHFCVSARLSIAGTGRAHTAYSSLPVWMRTLVRVGRIAERDVSEVPLLGGQQSTSLRLEEEAISARSTPKAKFPWKRFFKFVYNLRIRRTGTTWVRNWGSGPQSPAAVQRCGPQCGPRCGLTRVEGRGQQSTLRYAALRRATIFKHRVDGFSEHSIREASVG